MKSKNLFEFFAYYLMVPIIFIIGSIGNILGLIVLSNKNIKSKFSPIEMYKFLFISNSVILVLMIEDYFNTTFKFGLSFLSKYVCKLYYYISFSLATISPMILLYISVEKLVSMKYPSKVYLFRRANVQLICLVFIIAFNSVYYLPVVYHTELTITKINDTNFSGNFNCGYNNLDSKRILFLLDIINRILVSVVLINLCSIIILVSIFRMRTTILQEKKSINNHKNMQKQIKLLVNLLVLNAVYVVLTTPLEIVSFYDFGGFDRMVILYVYYAANCPNFYIILFTNSEFRKEFLKMIKNK